MFLKISAGFVGYRECAKKLLAHSVHIKGFKVLQEVCFLVEGFLAALIDLCGLLGGHLLLLTAFNIALLHLDLECAHLILICLLLLNFLRLTDILPHVLVDHAAAVKLGVRRGRCRSSCDILLDLRSLFTSIHLS